METIWLEDGFHELSSIYDITVDREYIAVNPYKAIIRAFAYGSQINLVGTRARVALRNLRFHNPTGQYGPKNNSTASGQILDIDSCIVENIAGSGILTGGSNAHTYIYRTLVYGTGENPHYGHGVYMNQDSTFEQGYVFWNASRQIQSKVGTGVIRRSVIGPGREYVVSNASGLTIDRVTWIANADTVDTGEPINYPPSEAAPPTNYTITNTLVCDQFNPGTLCADPLTQQCFPTASQTAGDGAFDYVSTVDSTRTPGFPSSNFEWVNMPICPGDEVLAVASVTGKIEGQAIDITISGATESSAGDWNRRWRLPFGLIAGGSGKWGVKDPASTGNYRDRPIPNHTSGQSLVTASFSGNTLTVSISLNGGGTDAATFTYAVSTAGELKSESFLPMTSGARTGRFSSATCTVKAVVV